MNNNKDFCKNAYIREYNKSKYKDIKIACKPDDFNIIDTFCKNNGISKAQFIVKACKYCIDNNIILNTVDDNDK